jgi:hypothetical protein
MSRIDEVKARLAELYAMPYIPGGEDGYPDIMSTVNSETAELEGELRGLEARTRSGTSKATPA